MIRSLYRAGTVLVLALLAGMALSGCSQGPDRAEVQALLQQQVDPRAEVVVVERIDSMNAAERGEVWLVDVEATLLFPRDLADVARDMGDSESGETALDHLGRLGLVLRFGEFEAGETRPYRTRLELIEGRDGWMPVDD